MLLEKSALLAAAGIALLAARLAMRHWWPNDAGGGAGATKEADHA